MYSFKLFIRDNWAPSPPQCNIETKQSVQTPSIMTRSHINHSKNLDTPQSIENQIQSHSLTQLASQNLLANETYATEDEETLVENSQLNVENILVNELNEVNNFLDTMSLDKMANEILSNKPNQQALATLKEKRRTVKELMSKFENK